MREHSSAPSVGAIVWAYLPEEGSARKAKLRPVLIIDVQQKGGLTYLTVAKGTSQRVDKVYLGELRISDPSDLSVCGLSCETKFQLQRREEIPFSPDWCTSEQRPLPAHLLKQLVRAAQEIRLI